MASVPRANKKMLIIVQHRKFNAGEMVNLYVFTWLFHFPYNIPARVCHCFYFVFVFCFHYFPSRSRELTFFRIGRSVDRSMHGFVGVSFHFISRWFCFWFGQSNCLRLCRILAVTPSILPIPCTKPQHFPLNFY